MLSTPLICCSIGVATDCSTVCASAPTKVVCTCTSGGAIAGNCDTGRLMRVIAPTITVSSEITMATIGRLMKNFDMLASCLGRFGGADLHGSAVSHLHQSFHHYALAGLHPVSNDPHLPYSFSHRYGTDTDFVVAAYDGDLTTALELDHRSLWNQQSSILCPHGCADSPIGAWTKKIVGVRENACDLYGARSRIYFTIGKVDGSRSFIRPSIGEYQLQRYALS